MKRIVNTLAPALLILLFTYAAISKIAAPVASRHEMHNQLFPPAVADILWILVPFAECTVVGMLMSERWQTQGLLLSSLLMGLFTGYITFVLLGFGNRVPCSCGGVLKHMSWGTHLMFNLFFFAISAAAWLIRYKAKAENLRKE